MVKWPNKNSMRADGAYYIYIWVLRVVKLNYCNLFLYIQYYWYNFSYFTSIIHAQFTSFHILLTFTPNLPATTPKPPPPLPAPIVCHLPWPPIQYTLSSSTAILHWLLGPGDKGIRSFETCGTTHATQCRIQGNLPLQQNCCQNLKSCVTALFFHISRRSHQ